MKIEFNSDDDFPLSKIIEIHSMIIVARAVFMKITNITQKIFLGECLYKLWKNTNALLWGIDVNKTDVSKECNICHYLYFLTKGFKFQPNVCNGYHDMLMMFMVLNIAALLVELAKIRPYS